MDVHPDLTTQFVTFSTPVQVDGSVVAILFAPLTVRRREGSHGPPPWIPTFVPMPSRALPASLGSAGERSVWHLDVIRRI